MVGVETEIRYLRRWAMGMLAARMFKLGPTLRSTLTAHGHAVTLQPVAKCQQPRLATLTNTETAPEPLILTTDIHIRITYPNALSPLI